MIKYIVWGRVRKILKKVREEDNGDFWTDRILSMKEIDEGLELLEKGYNAKVDRDAEPPHCPVAMEDGLSPEVARFRQYTIDQYRSAQALMIRAGWVKEEK